MIDTNFQTLVKANLEEVMVVSNYKKMCELLNEKIGAGNTKEDVE